MIPRGSGDHHPSGPGPSGPRPCRRIGNKPWRYAARSVPGARSAPTPAISAPSTICAGDGSSQRVGGGSNGTARTLPNRSDLRLRASRGPICDRRHRPLLAWRDAAGPSNRVRARLLPGCSWCSAPLLAPCSHRSHTRRARRATQPICAAQADALSSRYFSALDRVQSLDDDIAASEQLRDELADKAKEARDAARARALVAYTTSGTQLSTLVDGDDTLDTARRAHLIDRVNAHDQDVYAKLEKATRALHKQQQELKATRARAGRRARRAQVAGRGDRRQARPGRGAGAGADRGSRGRGVEGRRDHDDGSTRGRTRRRGRAHDHHHAGSGTGRAGASGRLLGHARLEPAPRRPVPRLRPPARERRQLQRREPVGSVPRRLPVPPGHLERHRLPCRPRRPRGRPAQRRRRRTTRTRWHGRSTSGRAPAPGAGAASSARRSISSPVAETARVSSSASSRRRSWVTTSRVPS